MLSTVIDDEIDALGGTILQMRGSTCLEQNGANDFLYEFSDAAFVVLLDHLNAQPMQTVWRGARDKAQRGDLRGAERQVLRYLRGTTGESQALASFLVR